MIVWLVDKCKWMLSAENWYAGSYFDSTALTHFRLYVAKGPVHPKEFSVFGTFWGVKRVSPPKT